MTGANRHVGDPAGARSGSGARATRARRSSRRCRRACSVAGVGGSTIARRSVVPPRGSRGASVFPTNFLHEVVCAPRAIHERHSRRAARNSPNSSFRTSFRVHRASLLTPHSVRCGRRGGRRRVARWSHSGAVGCTSSRMTLAPACSAWRACTPPTISPAWRPRRCVAARTSAPRSPPARSPASPWWTTSTRSATPCVPSWTSPSCAATSTPTPRGWTPRTARTSPCRATSRDSTPTAACTTRSSAPRATPPRPDRSPPRRPASPSPSATISSAAAYTSTTTRARAWSARRPTRFEPPCVSNPTSPTPRRSASRACLDRDSRGYPRPSSVD